MAETPEISFDAIFDRMVTQALGVSEVPSAETDLFEAGLDSLGFVSLLMDLEDEFQGFWPVEQLSDFTEISTVGVLRSVTRNTILGTKR